MIDLTKQLKKKTVEVFSWRKIGQKLNDKSLHLKESHKKEFLRSNSSLTKKLIWTINRFVFRTHSKIKDLTFCERDNGLFSQNKLRCLAGFEISVIMTIIVRYYQICLNQWLVEVISFIFVISFITCICKPFEVQSSLCSYKSQLS